MSDLVKIGGLWENTSKKGDVYMKGSLGMANIFLFKNTNKRSEKSPDWFMSVGSKDDDSGFKEDAPKSDAPAEPESDVPF